MLNEKIIKLAKKLGWECVDFQKNIEMISFKKDCDRVNIYISKMTVATCINHPKKGKTQLFRKNVSIEELEKIFNNPRIHTRKGYYTQ